MKIKKKNWIIFIKTVLLKTSSEKYSLKFHSSLIRSKYRPFKYKKTLYLYALHTHNNELKCKHWCYFEIVDTMTSKI